MQPSTHHTHTHTQIMKQEKQKLKEKKTEKSDLGGCIYRSLAVLLQDDPEPKPNAIVKRIKH